MLILVLDDCSIGTYLARTDYWVLYVGVVNICRQTDRQTEYDTLLHSYLLRKFINYLLFYRYLDMYIYIYISIYLLGVLYCLHLEKFLMSIDNSVLMNIAEE